MKTKIFALSLALILALSLTACGGKKTATQIGRASCRERV